MNISMKARQAKIEALNTALAVIQKEIDHPTGFVDIDGNFLASNPLYVKALGRIVESLEDMRDQAALLQYRLADRKALKREMLEIIKLDEAAGNGSV